MNARGIEAARLHLKYIERDGVEKDGSPGRLYGDALDREALTKVLPDERHQFRFIISPEDAHDVDLGDFTRRLMSDVQSDLGRRLVWGAVNHYNTDNPHVHVIVRGIDADGDRVRIDPDYITHGMRWRAQHVMTRELEQMRRAFSQWAHFVNPPEYLPAREAERAALLRFANAPALDAVEALGQIDPRRIVHDFDGREDEPRRRLYRNVLAVLERRATDAFIKRLDEVNAVASIGAWSKAGRFLVRGSALLWASEFRLQLRTGLIESGRSPARSDNAMDLLTVALERSSEAQPALLDDADLVQLLWEAATAIAPNMRRFQSFAVRR
jgi:hypothetical protein